MLDCTACDVPCDAPDGQQCPSCNRWYCSDDFENHDCEVVDADEEDDDDAYWWQDEDFAEEDEDEEDFLGLGYGHGV